MSAPEYFVTSHRVQSGGMVKDERWVGMCGDCPYAYIADDLQAVLDAVSAHRNEERGEQ